MNEPLFLAFFVWAIVHFDEWQHALSATEDKPLTNRGPEHALEGCGIALAGGAATAMTDGSSARLWASLCCGPLCSGGGKL